MIQLPQNLFIRSTCTIFANKYEKYQWNLLKETMMKRRLLFTMMLAIIGLNAAFAQKEAPEGPILNVSCSGPEASYEIISHEIVNNQIRRYSHPIMRVKQYNGTDVISKWKFYIEESDLEQLLQQLNKNKVWKQNGYEPKNPPRGASLSGFKLLFEMDKEVTMCFADPKENKKVTEAYNIVNDFCRNLAKLHPAKQRADLIYASCAATHHGGLGKDFYEMYNDPGTDPKIVSVFRYNTPEYSKNEYPITAEEVKGLQEQLYRIDLEEIRNYNRDDAMMGGTTYRVHLEFADGDMITATWCTHEPLPEAETVYNTIGMYLGSVIKGK